MALTRDFKETVMARAQRDPAFREGLLTEAIECFLGGDIATGKILLRDYINATIGFQQLARVTGKKDTSLMRMLGPKGNPAAGNLFELIALLQKHEGVRFQITPQRKAPIRLHL
jgi:DNA-binding phage protein